MFYASLQTGVVQLDRCDLFAFNALPEFHRADTLGFAECLREITQRGETKKLGDLGHGQVGFCQKILAFVNPAGDQIIDRGDPVFPLECMRKIVFIHVSFISKLFQC